MAIEINLSATNVVATGNTTIGDVVLDGEGSRIAFEVAVADQNLDAFIVQVQPHKDAAWHTYIDDWTTPDDGVVYTSGNPAALTAGSTVLCLIDQWAFYALRFIASAAVNGADINIRGLVV